jgi:uncharacterized membrane protein
MQGKKTALGLDEPVEGLLCYAGWWVTGVIFLIVEPDNRFIRFHAIQSIITFGALSLGWGIVAAIFGFIPVVGRLLTLFVGLAIFTVWMAMMYRAYRGSTYKLPIAGDIAEKYAKRNQV